MREERVEREKRRQRLEADERAAEELLRRRDSREALQEEQRRA